MPYKSNSTSLLFAIRGDHNILPLYSQLQKNVLAYAIFITQLDRITVWDYNLHTVSTTCPLSDTSYIANFQAYKHNLKETPIVATFMTHEQESQDGYKIPYEMICSVHSVLAQIIAIALPTLTTKTAVELFICKGENWLIIEAISKHNNSSMDNLTWYILEYLKDDGRFSKAVSTICMKKELYEGQLKIYPTYSFPLDMTIETLLSTTIQCYSVVKSKIYYWANHQIPITMMIVLILKTNPMQ